MARERRGTAGIAGVGERRDRTVRRWPPGRPGVPPAPALVLLSMVGIQSGHACGKLLFGAVGPTGVAALRLGFTALVLLVIWRPRIPADRRSRLLIVGFGTVIAGMNTIFLALAHLPIGVTVTLQFLGPLAVALAGSRRRADVVWALLAGLGVYLFANPEHAGLPAVGVGLALFSGGCWGAYIVLNKHAGARTTDGSILTLAVTFAALLAVPIGVAEEGTALLRPGVLLAGFGVAVLSAIVPYSLDLAALRRMPSHVFGILMSLEPVLGGIAGLLLLGERLSLIQWLAIGCVTRASVGAVTRGPPQWIAGTRSAAGTGSAAGKRSATGTGSAAGKGSAARRRSAERAG